MAGLLQAVSHDILQMRLGGVACKNSLVFTLKNLLQPGCVTERLLPAQISPYVMISPNVMISSNVIISPNVSQLAAVYIVW